MIKLRSIFNRNDIVYLIDTNQISFVHSTTGYLHSASDNQRSIVKVDYLQGPYIGEQTQEEMYSLSPTARGTSRLHKTWRNQAVRDYYTCTRRLGFRGFVEKLCKYKARIFRYMYLIAMVNIKRCTRIFW